MAVLRSIFRYGVAPLLTWVALTGVALAADVDEAGASPLSAPPSGAGYLAQLTLGLMVVLLGIVALAWLLKRMNGLQGSAGGALKVLGGVSVGQRERVVLLQVGDRQLLIGVAPGSVRTLQTLDEPINATQSEGHGNLHAGSFGARLSAMLNKGKAQ